jgi:transcriptional regulator with XRE-family HTH domain
MATPIKPGAILARNIAAERSRLGLDQKDLADRMRAVGWKWVRQTVGEAEKGHRRLSADEVLGLAACLETTVEQLMSPRKTDAPVELPSGQLLASIQVMALVSDTYDGPTNRGTRWVGNAFEQGWSAEAVSSWGTGFPRES